MSRVQVVLGISLYAFDDEKVPVNVRRLIVALSLLSGCQERVTFLTLEDVPVMLVPTQRTPYIVGVVPAGTLVKDAPVVSGVTWRFYQINLADGGIGYVQGGTKQFQVYP